MKLLIVEDEKDLNRIIVRTFEEEGYKVDYCFDGAEALHYIMTMQYDAIILDIMIPEMNGYQVLHEMRSQKNETPVLFLTAKDTVEDIVEGLDKGADDYMVKPFDFDELLARVRVITRRKPEIHKNIYYCGDLVVDCSSHMVKRAGKEINLSPREYDVLEYLARNKNIVVSRSQIESNIWSIDYDVESNVIDVYIRYLRKKIDEEYEVKLIQTVRGAGYMLKCEN